MDGNYIYAPKNCSGSGGSEFKCHVANSDGNYREVETDFFDDKCDEFIEGYQFIPEGENWTHSNNTIFNGEMIAPWKDYSELII